jgi:signal transduction histidine kinase/CheY-like chemotaxis protein
VSLANPWVLPSLLATALSLGLLLYVRVRRPPPPLWPSLPASLLGGLLFAVGDVLSSFLARGPVSEAAGLLLIYTGVLLLSASAWVLVLRVAEVQGAPFSWGRSPWARAPVVFAALMWLVVLTNPWHGAFLTPQLGPRSQYHWLWYANTIEAHGVIGASALLCVRLALRARTRAARSQALLMSGALAVPAACNFAYILPETPPPFDPTSLGLCVTGAVFVFGIYRRRLFALEPIDFAELLRQQSDGVLLVGRSGHLLYRNPASDRWIDPQSGAPGAPAFPLLAGRLVPAASAGAPLDAAQLEAELCTDPQPREGRLYRVPDEDAWLRVECRPIRSARGRLQCWMLRLRDETALRRSEEAVQHAQKVESLGVLAGGIAHDFNNLLLVMLGNAGLAREELPPASRAADYLADVERAAERAADLTRQLLAYAGKGRLEVVELDVSRLAREVVDLVGVSISKQIELHCRLGDGLPAVTGDASQLRQVVMNLVLNAADAIGDHEGAIAVESELVELGEAERDGWLGQEAWSGGRFVALRVADTGGGMVEAVRRRIFEPFFTTKATGRGLGLAATLGIVRSHGGWIRVESRPGLGSTFSVLLPAGERAAAAPPPPRPSAAATWRSDATVLVVDDEAPVAKVAARTLASAGMQVLVASDGAEALSFYRERAGKIDLVLLDLNMPGLPGAEVYRALRRESPGLPILLSSGYPEQEALARIEGGEAVAFLQKPYGADTLRRRVRALLEGTDGPPSADRARDARERSRGDL